MDVCVLQEGRAAPPRNARPDTLLRPVAPDRAARGGAVAGVFPWDGLADLWAQAGLPLVRGHALSLQTLQGGKATHDKRDAHTLAVRLRGGRLPPADVSPAAMRATRALVRRRLARARQRAARLARLQHTTSPDHWPASGTTLASNAHRAGVAARGPAPAGPQSLAVARAVRGSAAPRRSAGERPSVTAATPHAAQPLSWLQPVPGSGTSLRRVLLDALPALPRCRRGQDGVSAGRLGPGAQATAGHRDGTSGSQRGHASRPWACAAAAGWLRRDKPAGPPARARREKQTARARRCPCGPSHGAVRFLTCGGVTRGARGTPCSMAKGGAAPAARGHEGPSRGTGLGNQTSPAATNAQEPSGAWSCPGALAGTPAPLRASTASGPAGGRGLPRTRTWPSLAPAPRPPCFGGGR